MTPIGSRPESAVAPQPRPRGVQVIPESFPPCDQKSAATEPLRAVPNRRRIAGAGIPPAARSALAAPLAAVRPLASSVQRPSKGPQIIFVRYEEPSAQRIVRAAILDRHVRWGRSGRSTCSSINALLALDPHFTYPMREDVKKK